MNLPPLTSMTREQVANLIEAAVAVAIAAERERVLREVMPLLKRMHDIAFGVTLYEKIDHNLLASRIDALCAAIERAIRGGAPPLTD
jgi:hypothetical protein